MTKFKYLFSVLIFTVLVSITTSVNAEVVSYGWAECNYECSVSKSKYLDKEDAICHDRWKPENNSCKKSDGSFQDSTVFHENALQINFGDDQVLINGTTDLFGFTSDKYVQDKDVNYFDIKAGTKNVYVYSNPKPFQHNEKIRSILMTTHYVHDFRPIFEYYKKNGKYPDYIVIDYEAKYKAAINVANISYAKYTYYPSDYMTTEHKYIWDEGWVDSFFSETNLDILDCDFIEDQNESGPTSRREYCKRTDLDRSSFNSNLAPADSGEATVHYYFARNLSTSANLLACDDMDADYEYVKKLFEELGEDNETYRKARDKFDDDCENYYNKYYKNANSRCSSCKTLLDDIAKMDPSFTTKTNYCGFGDDMVAWLLRALKILRYIVPVLVIVLSIFDYIGAIMSDQDDAIKKAGGRLGKRLFIMIIFLAMPSILQFLLNVFNVDGLSSSNPYCLKK